MFTRFFFFFFRFFRLAKASEKRARRERHERREKRSSLVSRLSSFAWKTPKKITPVMQGITPGQRLKVEFMKKKNTREVAKRQEGKGFSVKNETYFERNEDCVWLANMVVSVESMRSLLRLPILIIKIKKTLGTVLSLSCKSEIRLYIFFYWFFCLTNGSLAQDLFKEFIWNVN